MSRHFEHAEGLSEEPRTETKGFVFNQTMLRIKNRKRSLNFYTQVLGMTLVKKLDFPEMEFSLYFLASLEEEDREKWSQEGDDRLRETFSKPGMLELTYNWGDEEKEDLSYHNGNNEPKGFGHIGFSVPDLDAACARFEELGVEFVKKPSDGSMRGIAFIKDPDGYWIEIFTPATLPENLRSHLA